MTAPRLNRLGRVLPVAWQEAIVRRSRGLDLPAILADAFLEYPDGEHGFDPVATKRTFFLLEQTAGRYFRTTTMGAENIPHGRALIVACHAGVVPWDATLLLPEIYRLTGRFSWNAGHEYWGRYAPIRQPLVRTGVVLGGPSAFEELLLHDELCTIFADAGEGMRRAYYLPGDRYKVKRDKGFGPGRGGYVKVALRTGSPVVPVAIVGAEEVHYCLGEIPQLAQYLGIPFFPLVASLVPLPARFYIRFGEALRLDAPPGAADDQDTVDRLNERIRSTLQDLIDDTLRRRRGIYWSSYDGSDGNRARGRGPRPVPAPEAPRRVAA